MSSLVLFAGMTFAICLAPGPNVMLVIGYALKRGYRPALHAIVGISLVNVLYLILAAAGLVALVVASAPLFALVRYCGAAYLIYLGYKMLRAAWSPHNVEATAIVAQDKPLLQGVLTHLSNPKGVLYWSALLPQFLDATPGAAYSIAVQIFALGSVAVTMDFIVMFSYALIFASASHLLRNSRYFRWIETVAGAFFMVSGLLLGSEQFDVKKLHEI